MREQITGMSAPAMVMDTAESLRRLAYVNQDDPRAIFLLPDTYAAAEGGSGDVSTDLSSWTSSYNRGESSQMSYRDQAIAHVDESGTEVSAEYIEAAIQATTGLLTFYSEPRVYLSYLFSELRDRGVTTVDLAEAYTEWEASGVRTQISAIDRMIDDRLAAIIEMNEVNERIISSSLDPLSDAVAAVDSSYLLDSSRSYANTIAHVTLDGEPITLTNLTAVMKSIILGDRLFYISRKTLTANIYRVHRGSRVTEDLPVGARSDELLILVHVPGQKNREVRVSASSSTITVSNDDDLQLISESLPGLMISSRTRLSLSSTVTFQYTRLYLEPFYMFLQTTYPWNEIVGVDDSQFDRGQRRPRTLLFRYNKYPIHAAVGVDSEEIIRLDMSLIRVLHAGEVEEGILFSASNVNDAQADRIEYIMGRALNDYEQQLDDLLQIYSDEWSDLSEYLANQQQLTNTTMGRIEHLQLLRPDVFGGDYLGTCDKKRPIVIDAGDYDENDDGMAEVDGIFVSCEEVGANSRIEWRPRRDDPSISVPCCVSTSGRKNLISQEQELGIDQQGFLLGIEPIFGLRVRERKGATDVVRVGVSQTDGGLRSSLRLQLGETRYNSLFQNMTPAQHAPFLQSMWAHSERDISSVLSSTHLDSDLVIDGIAANLGLNIFVIEPVAGKLRFRIPRHRFAYYIPFYADRRCLLIYRYVYRRRVVYEPIRQSSGKSFIQSEEVSRNSIRIFKTQNVTELLNRDGSIFTLPDAGPYTSADLIRPQIIDGYGKCRGYIRDGMAFYYEHPRAPLLGDFLSRPDEIRNRDAYLEDRVSGSALLVEGESWKNVAVGTRLIGLPVSRTVGLDPTIPADRREDSRIRQELTWDMDRVRQYSSLQRDRSYLLQLTNWMYSLTRGELAADEFSDLIGVNPRVRYDFSILSSELGEYDFEDALVYLMNTGVTEPDSPAEIVTVPSVEIKRGLVQMLRVENDTRIGSEPLIPNELIGLEQDEETTRLLPDGTLSTSTFLTSTDSYVGWLATGSASVIDYANGSVRDITRDELRTYRYPYTLVSVSETRGVERWLVQNVVNGSYQRAMNCCARWLLRSAGHRASNTGFFTPMLGGEADRAMKYTIVYTRDESGLLTPDVKPDPNGVYLTLLAYPVGYKTSGNETTGYFAALLPLTFT